MTLTEEFTRDRDHAFASHDLFEIDLYLRKWGCPSDDLIWRPVHASIAGNKRLFKAKRLHSHKWLVKRGYSSPYKPTK